MGLNVYIDSDVMVASEIKGEQNHIESKKFMDYVLKTKDKAVCKNIPEEYVKEDSTFRYYCYSAFPDYAEMQARGEI